MRVKRANELLSRVPVVITRKSVTVCAICVYKNRVIVSKNWINAQWNVRIQFRVKHTVSYGRFGCSGRLPMSVCGTRHIPWGNRADFVTYAIADVTLGAIVKCEFGRLSHTEVQCILESLTFQTLKLISVFSCDFFI